MKNHYWGIEFDITAYRLKDDYLKDVWDTIFHEFDDKTSTENATKRANESEEKASYDWKKYHN